MTYAVTISGNNISFSMTAVEYTVSLSQSGLQGVKGDKGDKGDTGALQNNIVGAYLGAALAEQPLFKEASLYTDLRNQVYARGDRSGLTAVDTFDNLFDFSRATIGYASPAAGTLTEYAIDVPRFDHDPLTGAREGLRMEQSQTNLLLNTDADLVTQNVTVTAQSYTLSFYGTGTVTLSGASTAGPLVGTGAGERVTLTFTPTAGTLTLTVSGTVSDAQLVTGPYAGSYIPTGATTATRAADLLEVKPAVVADVLPSDGFTLYCKLENLLASGAIFTLHDGTFSNRIVVDTLSDRVRFRSVVGGTAVYLAESAAYGATGDFSVAIRCEDGNFRAGINGALLPQSATATVPTGLEELFIGRNVGDSFVTAALFEDFAVIPRALSDAELQAITS